MIVLKKECSHGMLAVIDEPSDTNSDRPTELTCFRTEHRRTVTAVSSSRKRPHPAPGGSYSPPLLAEVPRGLAVDELENEIELANMRAAVAHREPEIVRRLRFFRQQVPLNTKTKLYTQPLAGVSLHTSKTVTLHTRPTDCGVVVHTEPLQDVQTDAVQLLRFS